MEKFPPLHHHWELCQQCPYTEKDLIFCETQVKYTAGMFCCQWHAFACQFWAFC